MPDNVTAPGTGETFATDFIGGRHFSLVKLTFGPDGTADGVSDDNGLPVLGPLTDDELRAAPLAVSGPLTDAQLRAAAVTVALPAAAGIGAVDAPVAADETATTGLVGLLKGVFALLRSRLPSLIGGLVPVSVPLRALGTRDYAFAAGQSLAIVDGVAVRSAAVAATEVMICPSVRGFYRIGDADVVASVGAGSIPLEAGEKFHQQITPGQFVSFIRDEVSPGTVTVMPVA